MNFLMFLQKKRILESFGYLQPLKRPKKPYIFSSNPKTCKRKNVEFGHLNHYFKLIFVYLCVRLFIAHILVLYHIISSMGAAGA